MPLSVARTFTVPAPVPVVLDHLAGAGPGSLEHHGSRVRAIRTGLTFTLRERGPDRLVFVGNSESATSTDTITVRPVEGGAEVTYRVDLEIYGVAKLATRVLRVEFEKLADELVGRMSAMLSPEHP